jgi:hypothetical protein
MTEKFGITYQPASSHSLSRSSLAERPVITAASVTEADRDVTFPSSVSTTKIEIDKL